MNTSMENNAAISDLLQSITQLHQKMDGQVQLLSRLNELQPYINNNNLNHKYLICIRDRERNLIQAIHDAITVLEESRKAFRSKQLEGLRKKLMQALADNQ